ncbi:hypothetical protein QJ854_gp667 [Moumouvirus goulette]|uniref:Uncharacterized protein n=1 Tax=Moumouvirus goulette TaxID=1247379 RepID=M1NM63_9VIRU|nr:hypothetical protein QJ854_gp667 [Moumouvirus goulette]AGF85115.1 hypothetical protein glt_00306 [Moumouvirus goulette]
MIRLLKYHIFVDKIIRKMDNTNNQYIIYDTSSNFKIVPLMRPEMIKNLSKYINDLKQYYRSTYGVDCFFWKFDKYNHRIIIDESIDEVGEHIFEQIYDISSWVITQNYNLVGDFCSRTENSIEYTIMDGYSKFLTHYVYIDKVDPELFQVMIINNKNKMIEQAKIIINEYINKNNTINKYINQKNTINNTFNYVFRQDNNKISYSSKRYRKIPSYGGNLIQNIFTIIGVLTTAAFCVYIFSG